MKLRTKSGSIRLRLTRSEVEAFARTHRVEEVVVIGPGAELRFALVASDAAQEVTARMSEGWIEVQVPSALAVEWTSTERVGFSATQRVTADGTLVILVEKDFACLEPRKGEDDADAFPHPEAQR